jgi:transcription elongation factor GreA
MTDQTTWLTPSAFEKLTTELDELKTDGRRRIEVRLAEARSHGDLRENGDYDAAKHDQGLMEARIRQLEHLLARAEVGEAADDGTVAVGSVVTVVDSDGDEMECFVADQANKVPGYLVASPASPLGQAILGGRAGDEVTYTAGGRQHLVTIKDVRPYRG